MRPDREKILLDTLRRLLRRGAVARLKNLVAKSHTADLAAVFPLLRSAEQERLLALIRDPKQKARLFSELEDDIRSALLQSMSDNEVAEIVTHMSSDDVAALIATLPDQRAKAVLERMKREDSEEVHELLAHDQETAGRIMVPNFVALPETTSAREAVAVLQRQYADIEMPFYLYVVDDHGRLRGVVSLRQLVVVPPDTALKSIMRTDVVSVHTSTDQEEVAGIVAHYNLLAIPVVDDNNLLVGIVTVDDVIDVIQDEATEDVLKIAGITGAGAYVETQSILKSIHKRLPWLLAAWVGGVVASFVVGHFQQTLSKLISLAAFMPIVMGMGGNVGTQTSASIIRGLATGKIDLGQVKRVILREFSIGFCLGFVYGLMLSLFANLRYGFGLWKLGLVVGLAMICSMTLAATFASCLPLVLHRFRIDPAVASGPFVTTCTDILSVLFYFKIASFFLPL
ncbi:MAG: magnesium transporter [Deltaproteobacteria bacterium]|nr:magnesium transporter [Deltaproteobacteria bacterium]